VIAIIILIIIAGVSRAIMEQGKWRNSPEWSVLYGTWWLKHNHSYNIDGYHTSGRILVTAMAYLGWLLGGMQAPWWTPLVAVEAMYLIYGLFYHVVFTPKGKRDWRLFKVLPPAKKR
jgi:hypothetical protein